MRIVIELDADDPDNVVVQINRERAQLTVMTDGIISTQDAGPATADALGADDSDAIEVTDAGPAPESGADAGESAE